MENVLFGYEQTRVAGVIALFLATIAAIIYVRNMLRGERPSCATWLVWGAVSTTAAIIHRDASGSWDEQLIPIFYAIVPFVYLGLVWYLDGKWRFEWREKVSLVLAVLVWGIWMSSHHLGLEFLEIEGSLLLIVCVDIIGVYTTIEHARTGGEYGNRWSWMIATCATVVNLFSVSDPSSAVMIYPAYLALAMPIIALFTWYKPIVKSVEQTIAKHKPAPMAPRRGVHAGQ